MHQGSAKTLRLRALKDFKSCNCGLSPKHFPRGNCHQDAIFRRTRRDGFPNLVHEL